MNEDPNDPLPKSTYFRENWPYFWVNRANAYYARALDKRLRGLGMDVPRWRVLMSLYEQDYISISEIADLSTLKLNTATKIVQRMIVDGLVTTRVRPTDRRVTEACLTEKGEEVRKHAMVEVVKIRDKSFYNVTPAELETLNRILSRITKDLEPMT